MNKSIESQKSAFFGFITGIGLVSVLIGGSLVQAYTPEAETVLESLRVKVDAGEMGPVGYSHFLAELNSEDGCASWAEAAPHPDKDIWKAVLDACPEIIRPKTTAKKIHSRLSLSQGVEPRQPLKSGTHIKSESRSDLGKLIFSMRDFQLDHRSLALRANSLTVVAGHLQGHGAATRIDFIQGKRFYTGWSGHSGFTGPLESGQAALDGLGLHFQGASWQVDAMGSWNRLEPLGHPQSTPRRDALLYLVGASNGPFRVQLSQQRFESTLNRLTSGSFAGATFTDPQGRWHLGWGGSFWDWKRDWKGEEAHSKNMVFGSFAELAFGSLGNYGLKARQANLGWANALQAFPSYRRDTLAGEWILPGRGQGGLEAWSHLDLYQGNAYHLQLDNGGDIAWALPAQELLDAGARIALVQSLGDWRYTCGTGKRFHPSPTLAEPETPELQATGIGHILAVQKPAWKARLSMTQQKPNYQGPYPEPVALSLESRPKAKQRNKIKCDAFTGNLRAPLEYIRLNLSQTWDLERGCHLRQSLKLPWSSKVGWKEDLEYQVRLEANL